MFSFFLFAIKYPSLLDSWIKEKLTAKIAALAKYKKTDSSGFRRISQPTAARSGAGGKSRPVADGDLGSARMMARKLRDERIRTALRGLESIKRRTAKYKKTDGKV
ncbi:MAG: hypothetical protein M3R45_16995 [Pseudomonadota bacterium]|nr:hypothetical protein [Pseudomonadota bacterium]